MPITRRSFIQTAAVSTVGSFAATAAARSPQNAPAEVDPVDQATPAKLKLLFLGGTSFLGPHTVRAALARGHEVTLFNRGKSNPHLFPELEKLKGDRNERDFQSITEAMEDHTWDAVIDFSAYVPTHVQDIAELLADHIKQYVVFSSVSAYHSHDIPYLDETAPVMEITDEVAASMTTIRESLAEYGAMKARCEKAAEDALPGHTTAIRPGLIVGPGDISHRFSYWPLRVRDGGEVLAPGDGSDPVQWVDARDLAAWTITCTERSIVGTFNAITPPGLYNMAEMLYGLKASFTTDTKFTWVSTEFLQEQGVQPWGHLPVWVPAEEPMRGFHLTKSERAVNAGLTFRPLAETARDTAEWFDTKDEEAQTYLRSRAGLSPEREAEVLAAWHSRDEEVEEVEATDPEPAPEAANTTDG